MRRKKSNNNNNNYSNIIRTFSLGAKVGENEELLLKERNFRLREENKGTYEKKKTKKIIINILRTFSLGVKVGAGEWSEAAMVDIKEAWTKALIHWLRSVIVEALKTVGRDEGSE
jgi:hypothetical protein